MNPYDAKWFGEPTFTPDYMAYKHGVYDALIQQDRYNQENYLDKSYRGVELMIYYNRGYALGESLHSDLKTENEDYSHLIGRE